MKIVKTPSAEYLFTANPNAEKLNVEKAYVFHPTISQVLFLCKRPRPDIQPTMPLLCTRAEIPDEYDWKKLLRIIKYSKEK